MNEKIRLGLTRGFNVMWRPVAGLAGLAALVIWSGGACDPKVAPGKADYQPGRPLSEDARVYTVKGEQAAAHVDVVGSITSDRLVNLSARLGATVQSIPVSAGDVVTNGQVLVVLDDRGLRQQLALSEAQFKQAESEYRRAVTLFEKSATTAQAKEGAEAAFLSAQARLRETQVMLSYTLMTAPFDGVVTDRRVEAGDLAAPGQVLLSVYDPRRMRLDVPVPVRLLGQFHMGQAVDVTLDGFKKPLKGVVREVVSEVDPLSRTQKVKVHLDNTALPVLPGTYGWIAVEGETRNALWVPVSAVYRVGQQDLVQVVADGRALRRVVRTGAVEKGRVDILSGLAAGDVVLVDPVKED
jgi:membrane fusion protein (multidrug efflux system)